MSPPGKAGKAVLATGVACLLVGIAHAREPEVTAQRAFDIPGYTDRQIAERTAR